MNCLDTVESGSHVAAGSADMTIKVTDTSRSFARQLGPGFFFLQLDPVPAFFKADPDITLNNSTFLMRFFKKEEESRGIYLAKYYGGGERGKKLPTEKINSGHDKNKVFTPDPWD